MPTHSLNPLKSLDKYFLSCKIVVLLLCLPWPLTLVASLMSLAGQFPEDTPMLLRVLVRLGWLVIVGYPVVFLAVVFVAEKVLARKSYAVGAIVASLPIAFSVFAAVWLFGT
jgi:hypothetical protein